MTDTKTKKASLLTQGCQMAYFQTENPNLGKFWMVLQWKILVYMYYMAIWSILQLFDIFCGYLLYFVAICYIFPRFGILRQEKSGNPWRSDRSPRIEPQVFLCKTKQHKTYHQKLP
jgi:hypothetical protein